MHSEYLVQALELVVSMAPAGRHLYLIRSLEEGADVTAVCGPVGIVVGQRDGALSRAPRQWSEMIHPADRVHLEQQLHLLRTGSGAILRYRLVTNGEMREVEEHLKVLPGVPLRALSVVYNVNEAAEPSDPVVRLETDSEGKKRMETLGEMTAGVIHDVNGLFTLILNAADLAKESDPPDSVSEEIEVILGAAVRGGSLFRGLLEFVRRGEQGHAHPVDLTAVVRALEPILRRCMGEDVTLRMDFGSAAWPIMGVRGEIEQVLLNLTANACDAMPRGGSLGIATRNITADEPIPIDGGGLPPGDYVCLEIADTGMGISHEVRERIFERYVSTKKSGSSGFGLATVKRIVQGHSGGVQVLSAVGQGTRFIIHFPAHHPAAAGAVPPLSDSVTGDRTALLVLPEANQRADLERHLRERSWRTVPTMTARDALSAYDRARPRIDLVVTAAVLPDRTGEELQEALRRRTPGLRILTLETVLSQIPPEQSGASWFRSVPDLLQTLDEEASLRRNG